MRRRSFLVALAATPRLARAQDGAELRDAARRAAIYLAPLYEMYVRRHRDVVEHGQKLNRLSRQLAPENGVLSAAAWLDLSVEPLFLTLPPMGQRSGSAVLLDPFTNTFARIGATPEPHMIVGPAWKGAVPTSEVTEIRAPSRSAWLRIGIAVNGDDDDLDAARALQARLRLETPDQRNERRIIEMRELMRQRTVAPPEPVVFWQEPRPGDPFDLFDAGLAMLAECVLTDQDRQFLESLAPLSLRPGRKFDARAFSETERAAIVAGIADAVKK
ncbi:MAG: DUF1254 domain-containing protein [Alphaproteobacteria bacterium]|nr:DUF1254 domain-containing protein [Alphaproteobacteria bacterium]